MKQSQVEMRLAKRSQGIDKPRGGFNTTKVPVSSSTMQHDHKGAEDRDGECDSPHIEPRDSGLFLIGLFKLSKAVFFLGVSLGALHFVHHDLPGTVDRIMHELHFDPEGHIVDLITDRVVLVTHHKLRLISMGTSLYAALCTAEAYGLLTRKVWAEYVTMWLSVSFIPWELFEVVTRPSLWHASILLTNILVVAYLFWMLRRKKTRRSAA